MKKVQLIALTLAVAFLISPLLREVIYCALLSVAALKYLDGI